MLRCGTYRRDGGESRNDQGAPVHGARICPACRGGIPVLPGLRQYLLAPISPVRGQFMRTPGLFAISAVAIAALLVVGHAAEATPISYGLTINGCTSGCLLPSRSVKFN